MLAETHDQTQDTELDAGPRGGAAGSERFCAVTGQVMPVDDMIRFVVAPDGSVVPDLKRKLPGRGLWITATGQALTEGVRRKVFARGFKRDVRVTPDLLATTERLIERAALDALAIVHKSGLAAIGFAKTDAALTHERVVALLNASDGAPDGSRKLLAALRQREDADGITVVEAFTSAQLDLAFGRSNVIHAALLAGPGSDTFMARVGRLERFRSGRPEDPGRQGLDRQDLVRGKRR